jgi:hypothetical protein
MFLGASRWPPQIVIRYLAKAFGMGKWIWSILATLLLLLLLANWSGIIGFALNRYRQPEKAGGFSFAPPFIGGVLGCIGCLICPIDGVRRFAWVPLAVDPSILLMTIAVFLHLVARVFGFPSPFGRGRAAK